MLRCLQIGLSIRELDLLTIGMVNDMFIENMNDDYKYGHIRINLWIEGEDAEARLDMTDMNTPSFKFNLVFDAVASQQSNTP